MKVLVIDDEEDTRSIATMSLKILGGVEVIEADSGKVGLCKAENEMPDVILLDMMMPEMDGSQTLIRLQNDDRTKGIPVIFLTAKSMQADLQHLKKLGAAGVLTKPFDPMVLFDQVREILEG